MYKRVISFMQIAIVVLLNLCFIAIVTRMTDSAIGSNVNILARIISAESNGEPYIGQVAVGRVILNRIENPTFSETLSSVFYQKVSDGQFNQPVSSTSYAAAKDALAGRDPSGGCVYYYDPAKTDNRWIDSNAVKVIGKYYFYK